MTLPLESTRVLVVVNTPPPGVAAYLEQGLTSNLGQSLVVLLRMGPSGIFNPSLPSHHHPPSSSPPRCSSHHLTLPSPSLPVMATLSCSATAPLRTTTPRAPLLPRGPLALALQCTDWLQPHLALRLCDWVVCGWVMPPPTLTTSLSTRPSAGVSTTPARWEFRSSLLSATHSFLSNR